MSTDRPAWPVCELTGADRPALERHFLALGTEDRRLRFGVPLREEALCAYVRCIDFNRDAVFGVVDDGLRLVGVVHLASLDEQAEVGVSVLLAHRNRGVGYVLLETAIRRARNWGVRALYMHCLGQNKAIMHLARKQGMNVVRETGEADARVELPSALASVLHDALAGIAALFAYALKHNGSPVSARLNQPIRVG